MPVLNNVARPTTLHVLLFIFTCTDGVPLPVLEGQLTLIEIPKGMADLGIKLKSHGTNLGQNWVVIERVFPEGNIAKDGRLRPGDRILKVGRRGWGERQRSMGRRV